jgi:hypothetical protein
MKVKISLPAETRVRKAKAVKSIVEVYGTIMVFGRSTRSKVAGWFVHAGTDKLGPFEGNEARKVKAVYEAGYKVAGKPVSEIQRTYHILKYGFETPAQTEAWHKSNPKEV